MLKSLSLKNYKGFKETGVIEFKPITVVFGKNSSGKSSICKLLPILRDGLSNYNEPLPLVSKEGVRVAFRYEDLFRNRIFSDPLDLHMDFENGLSLGLKYILKTGNLYHLNTSASLAGSGRAQAVTHLRVLKPGEEEYTLKKSDPFITHPNSRLDGTLPSLIDEGAFSVNFIGPIRAEAPRIVSKSDSQSIGHRDAKGAYTYYELMKSKIEDTSLLSRVSDWFKENMEGYEIEMVEISENMLTGFVPSVRKGDFLLNLSDVGEGITQILPIITQSFLDEENTITVLEQPALHLHPAIHAEVAKRLALSSKETGQRFVIESHSHNLLLGFQRMVANRDIPFTSDDVVIYFIDDEANVKKITIEEDGSLSDWPEGVFEEGFDLTRKIIDRE